MPLEKYKIAFVNTGGSFWPGGTSYLRNLFIALKSLPVHEQPEIALLLRPGTSCDDNLKPYVDQILFFPAANKSESFFKKIYRRLPQNRAASVARLEPLSGLEELLKKQGVHAIFENCDNLGLYRPLKIATLVWIPDFQHLYLPDMFSPGEIKVRNASFQSTARFATRVILSSQTALLDYQRFLSEFAMKGKVLSFVSSPPSSAYDTEPTEVCNKYYLPERFIYLPNQFWRHKNHAVVVDALRIACKTNPYIKVVCTGGMHEYRDPGYVPSIFLKIAEAGLHENFIVLGLIPHIHTYQLIRQSLAVLQPSLFEGWSTIVEETKSVGKSIILSDLPVHREQNPPCSFFFKPDDAEALASHLLHIFERSRPGVDTNLENFAREDSVKRRLVFGRCFMQYVHEAMSA